ncbi:MAG: hypothetical protein J0M17_03520 [Planctomycetes bacterium]|nr:hypothetical protein [Planctomycetota bacterium]
MTPAQYLKARAKLENDHRAKLKSLDEVWAMLNDSPPPQPIDSHEMATNQVRGAWRQLARQVIEGMPAGTQFTIREIESGIAEINPLVSTDRVQISIYLKQLADGKEIKVAEAGGGRRATIYKK